MLQGRKRKSFYGKSGATLNAKRKFYSHAYVYIRKTWMHGNQPNAFYMAGDLSASKHFKKGSVRIVTL